MDSIDVFSRMSQIEASPNWLIEGHENSSAQGVAENSYARAPKPEPDVSGCCVYSLFQSDEARELFGISREAVYGYDRNVSEVDVGWYLRRRGTNSTSYGERSGVEPSAQ